MNGHGIAAIYRFEMARWKRTLWQSLITPVITTALYFVVFGSALGSRMTSMEGVSFGAFIVPGLTLLSVFMQSIFNASFGIYFPKFTGTIYELLSAPISSFEPFRTISLFNPIVHVISGFRWSFYSIADVPVGSSVAVTLAIIGVCMAVIAWMFKTGYRLKQ